MSRFFEGGFTFEYAENLSIPELLKINEIAKKIEIEDKKGSK